MRASKVPVPVGAMAFAILAFVAFATGRVTAVAFPEEGAALSYSGLIADSSGAPILTTQVLDVELFSAKLGGTRLCGVNDYGVDLSQSRGRFSVPLPASCEEAVRDVAPPWVEVTVGTTKLPRRQLGSVPYAVVARNAQHAELASGAAPDSPLAGELDSLDGRLAAVESLELVANGVRYSTHAVFKRSTSRTDYTGALALGALTQYAAAKRICELELGTPTAHMCTTEEMARSFQLGLRPSVTGWVAAGVSAGPAGSYATLNDCSGWQVGNATSSGVAWNSDAPQIYTCNLPTAIHCCDSP